MSSQKLARSTAIGNYNWSSLSQRFYATSNKLNKKEVVTRIADVIKSFNVDNKQLTNKSVTEATSYYDDLGLDSLDTVELLVNIEEEFEIEIPDDVADNLKTVGETAKYVMSNPEST
ncbi:hypothetical protein KAFR_0A05670 [Kazachstania africana CBS 2517]|uniref:Acyl carrier protein n=1 Tax=Kazachstania africana (strain ATCC 22294 / BCRC 22015 / CBS 2517 / CECT 1963 / NBRC 1671 / NRRL Y-8276) TaxID=1071382 RepID=H2ANQ2_KAZAF|nr:hypothetical protein KAFR_0A05670 [Kazachstania africana CBS 2517]CCF56002.1 hypothetical protein KAFR_0A05670 [Kazachstania africana CBS 2517]